MTVPENNVTSPAVLEEDKQSRSLPGGQSGPNKDGATRPDGASALGNEIGAEGDAQRERAQAIREGDNMPNQETSNYSTGSGGDMGIGQQSGYEKGMSDTPSMGQRDNMQDKKNASWQSGQPDLGSIAKNSGGSANYNPTSDPDSIVSTGNSRASDVLDTAARSGGTESGFNAYAGGVVSNDQTDNVPNQ